MRSRFLLFLLLFISVTSIYSQDYRVPERLTIAGIKLKINSSARQAIQKDVDMLTKSPKYWEIKAERARTYFPIIEKVFAEEGIPDDLKYLVLQESALISDAVSSSNAVGFWQMKDFTAVELGLRVDRKIDERKNIVSSSYGAAKYLNKSQETFDNWLHSLQSYQMGIGGASKALGDKGKGDTSMNINMRTYWYVRKYIAHFIAYNNVMDKPASNPITIYSSGSGKNFSEIARETSKTTEEIKNLNKWLLHGRIPEDKTYSVVVPGSYVSADEVLTNSSRPRVSNMPVYSGNSSIYPRIKENKHRDHKYIIGINGIPGIIASATDNAMTLAQKGGITLSKFLKYNDLKNNYLVPGQVYYLKNKKRRAPTHYHSLEKEESLWEVSQKYGIRLKSLLSKNRIPKVQPSAKPGRILWLRFIRPEETPIAYSQIASTTPPVDNNISNEETDQKNVITELEIETPSVIDSTANDFENEVEIIETDYYEDTLNLRKRLHVVKKGDTYYSLSKSYQVSVLDLLRWNNLEISDKLSVGQKLKVWTDQTTPKTFSSDSNYHIVKAGETLYSISRAYDVSVPNILKWNNKSDSDIKIGEKLKITPPN